MKVYLVGGAIRDELLGRPIRERDWCVTGATPEQMTDLGYKTVGKDFPVFLHPETHEEYALARTERKTGRGYHGFQFHTSPDITIEDDLRRRDLTVNAIARDSDGKLVDPFGGVKDVEARVLRHVSEAFAEDPVRILRVAKFAARYAKLGFTVADETMALMSDMVANGEVDALVPDRVWKETETALCADSPRVYFETLRACGALKVLFPEVDALFGVPQTAKWHPEIDTGIHTMMVLDQATAISDDGEVRFAALVHDLGKGTTDPDILPAHHGHEIRSVKLLKEMARRLPVPGTWRDLGLLAAEFHTHVHTAFDLRPKTLLKLLRKTDGLRRPERFEQFVQACEADSRGRTGFEDRDYPQADYVRGALRAVAAIDMKALVATVEDKSQIADTVQRAQLGAVKKYVREYQLPK